MSAATMPLENTTMGTPARQNQAWSVEAIRSHFDFVHAGRTVTNNAASTQPPRELLALHHTLAQQYVNVHRVQSSASMHTTKRFEAACDDIACFVGASSRNNIIVVHNPTAAHNAVMYSLMTEFRDGDNIVTTELEHNSNFVPWFALCNHILPKFGRHLTLRLTRFDPDSGELDLAHLASLIDDRTKLVCCTAAANFLGPKPPIAAVRTLAAASRYSQPNGERRSYLLVDGAQWVPGNAVDFASLDADYLSFSFHKMLVPFGVGVLVAKEHLLESSLPFMYGGDMVGEGQVFADRVGFNALPLKYAEGTPHIIGTIVAAQALRLIPDLALQGRQAHSFGSPRDIDRADVVAAMGRIASWNGRLAAQALERLAAIPCLTIYGPREAQRRSLLVAFNVQGRDAVNLARALNEASVEARAGCHCAALAHRSLGINASCRLSFYFYNTPAEVDRAVDALAAIVAARSVALASPRERARAQTRPRSAATPLHLSPAF